MSEIYWGDSQVRRANQGGSGELVFRDGETFYKITNYHTMPAFFVTVVSGSDHWMYLSSSGGLTCGRGNSDNALFPYYTDDKIHDAHSTTGPKTVLLVGRGNRTFLWKPFENGLSVYAVERNLYKNLTGNKLIFEEFNHSLGLVFSYGWSNSDRFGFVRNATLANTGDEDVQINVLDGLRNLLPAGVTRSLQTELSTLVDAYKQAEAFQDQCAAVYTMSSTLTDRAEPSEALKATVVWSMGMANACVLLAEDQVEAFCAGATVTPESVSHGKRGAFFIQSSFTLPRGEEKDWCMMADINQVPGSVTALLKSIDHDVSPLTVKRDVEAGSQRLLELVGCADGCQISSDQLVTGRHFFNTLFNIMRGGTFYDEYRFPLRDFLRFVGVWNKPAQDKFATLLKAHTGSLPLDSVLILARETGDADLERIVLEYLPLIFSRRHGDPSRPWNQFSTDIRNEDGSDKLYYQGNWRDIFQNWEALAGSYPEYIESFVSKFVNASTADGYNPYRITKDGFEWELLEPGHAWSNIGYWGDHQVNYLLKLIELSNRYHPGKLSAYLEREVFVYADVPYRIRGYQELVRNPRNSVFYDDARDSEISGRVAATGSDGKLLTLPNGSIYKVNLLEKLLVTTLTKLSNFVPGGGVWMNTQRPEWNDANNALVGYGLSIVTLCYLRRFMVSLKVLLSTGREQDFSVSSEVLAFFDALERVLNKHSTRIEDTNTPQGRKVFMDEIGPCGESYRKAVYAGFAGDKAMLGKTRLSSFIDLAMVYIDQSLALSRRPDGLFHAYNLIEFGNDGYAVANLYEMLEGQVAVLSSGYLDAKDSLELLTALRSSRMYRQDQNSYLLYPDRNLPLFLHKNVIPNALIENYPWLQNELDSGRTEFVERDVNGVTHFNASFRNRDELCARLAKHPEITSQDGIRLCDIYEAVFNHRQFTGRSGAMYKYEGLGCIYWHMVSKLLLATAEVMVSATETGCDEGLLNALMERFDDIREGLGLYKTPARYGAFPVDPYSHTTGFSGVQQPGMTGQVKEDIITRFIELGVRVRHGKVSFAPFLLNESEFISGERTWHRVVGGTQHSEKLTGGSLAFSLCGVPVIYRLADSCSIRIETDSFETLVIPGNELDSTWSQSLFRREKRVRKIVVDLPATSLR